MLTLLWLACASPVPTSQPLFVRGGLIVAGDATDEGRVLADGRRLVARDWSAGEDVTVGRAQGIAPRQASCAPIARAPLGDVATHIARGGSPPDTQLAFSPDGAWLAVGTFTGDVLVIDAWSGAVRARRSLAETMVKAVAWSPDGKVLYAGEQSPDAFVHALDPVTLRSSWRLRLADLVETSAPPAGDDVYGVYTLPAPYGLTVAPSGELLVSAVHAWNAAGGRRNASRVLRVSATGEVLSAWPPQGALDGTLMHPTLRAEAGRVAVFVGRSAGGPTPAEVPSGAVVVLDWPGLSPVAQVKPEPLAPYYKAVFPWEGVGLTPLGDRAVLGLTDGRVLFAPLDGSPPLVRDPGAPVDAGSVPLVASVGHARVLDDTVLAVTSETHIPWGAAAPDTVVPSAHPRERTLFAWTHDGALSWTWQGPWSPQGIAVSPDQRLLALGAGLRGDERTDLYGALVFDLAGDGTGAERLAAVCATPLPVFFRMALSNDGRVAVVEHPVAAGGDVRGSYRVTVLR